MGILVPGDTFGDRDLLFKRNYRTSVRVITHCVLLRLDAIEIRKLLLEKIKLNNELTPSSPFLMQRDIGDRPSQTQLGRIVTIASLSRGIPDELIVENLAERLKSVTGESVLLVQLGGDESKLPLRDWAQIQLALSSEFYFASHLPRCDGGFNRLSLCVTGDDGEPHCIAPLLSQMGRHFRYVLLHIDETSVPAPPLLQCIIQSDVTYLLLQQNSDELYRFDVLGREARLQSKTDRIDIRPIVYVPDGRHSHEFYDAIVGIGTANQSSGSGLIGNSIVREVHYLDEKNGTFNADIRRLAREIGRCRIGLALSSGAARGLAHIGVIQVLEENGIEVDVIAGCSMGAYVAAVWAFGCDGKHMEKLARQVEGRWGLWQLLDFAFPPRRGFVQGRVIKNMLKQTIGDAHFCDLVRPLRIIATHLDSLERVVFSTGQVADAVHASSAIPGVCVPVTLGGETYIDGGIVDPLPVDVLADMGVEHIIAVNTIAPTEQRRYWLQMERQEIQKAERRWSLWKFLGQHLNYFHRGNVLDVITRGVHGAQIRAAEEACQFADVVLRPIIYDAHAHEFSNPGKYIALGRSVTEERIEEIKALVHEKVSHEQNGTNNKVAAAA